MVFIFRTGMPIVRATVLKHGETLRKSSTEEDEKTGGRISQRDKHLGMVNNPSSSFMTGLGTGSPMLSPLIKPSGTSITFGGSLHHGLKSLNFGLEKKGKNVKLRG